MKNNRKFANRYRGLIASVTIFIIMIVAVLGLDVYSTRQIGQNNLSINTAAEMRDAVQSITRDLFDAKLSWGEDPDGPHLSSVITRLEQNSEEFSRLLHVVRDGGEVKNSEGETRYLSPLRNSEDIDLIDQAATEWNSFQPAIQEYLATARDIFATSTPLDIVVDRSQSSSVIIYNLMSKLVANIQARAEAREQFLTRMLYVALGVTLIYFLIFIFFFIRKLRQADTAAITAEQETADIMNTVSEGLFLIDRDLQIGNQYSAVLEKILNTNEISGRNLKDLLERLVTPIELETTNDFIDQLYNPRVRENLIRDLNPLDRIRFTLDDGRGNMVTRWLSFRFSRVYENNDMQKIKHILTSVSDITNAVNLEQRLAREREQNNQQVEMLTTILRVDETLMESFVRNANGCNNRINNILRRPHHRQQDLQQKVEDIFREIHSFKGEASALQLSGFVDLANELEEKLKDLRNAAQLSGDDFLPLAVVLDQLLDLTARVDQLFARISKGNIGEYTESSNNALDSLPQQNTSVKSLSEHFKQFAERVAQRNSKEVVLKTYGFDNINLPVAKMDIVREIITQLLRNAIVHGIELPKERVAAGKNEVGQVQIHLTRNDENYYELMVEDDGKGIDFNALRAKARNLPQYKGVNVDNLSPKELLKILFIPGFSTAASSTEDAGRGVGMNVIKDRIQSLQGKLSINSIDGKYCNFTIKFPG